MIGWKDSPYIQTGGQVGRGSQTNGNAGVGGGGVGTVRRHQARSRLEETALFVPLGGVNGVFRRE